MTAPKRKIRETLGNPMNRRSRRGLIKTAHLECGHVEDCNAAERRRGWVFCFDCLYGRPIPAYSLKHEWDLAV